MAPAFHGRVIATITFLTHTTNQVVLVDEQCLWSKFFRHKDKLPYCHFPFRVIGRLIAQCRMQVLAV
jgi:hypothetical protein